MQKFYSVVCVINGSNTRLYHGESIEAVCIPNNTYQNTVLGEVWIDWFYSKKEATQFINGQI